MGQMVISCLIGYFLGCFQTSIFIGRLVKQIDIREYGSQNAGASNTTVILGLPYGVITAAIDILKAVIAIVIVRYLYSGDPVLPVLAGIAAVVGHIFPIFFGFRGGKGVACLIGTVLALEPAKGLIIVLVSVAVAIISDYVVVGSTMIYILFMLFMIFDDYPILAKWLAGLLLLVGLFKHISNYQRIINQTEIKISQTFGRKKD